MGARARADGFYFRQPFDAGVRFRGVKGRNVLLAERQAKQNGDFHA